MGCKPTQRLFYEDAYCFSFTGTVVGCSTCGEHWEIVLDRTAFYPEGGGQPADTGILGGANVLDVQERGGQIIHTADAPLKAGQEVSGRVDRERRLELMRHHTAEHIVSGLASRLYGCTNVGFHMGHDAVTMDYDRPLDKGQIRTLENKANEAVWENTPVLSYYPAEQELAALDYRCKKALEGAVRIVRAGDYDCCACCGLHVAHAGETGVIRLVSAQNYKGGTRVTMLCGMRALLDCREKGDMAAALTAQLSVKPGEILQGVLRLQEELAAAKQRQAALENRLFDMIASATAPDDGKACLFEEGLSADGLRRLCMALCGKCRIAAVFSGTEGAYKYAVGSTKTDVRPLAQSLREHCGGRGGGKTGLIQGSAEATRKQIEEWVEKFL